MQTISKVYRLKWQLKIDNKYQWSECGKLFNIKTGKEIKKTIKGSKIGYWINKDFCKLADIRNQIELIKNKPF